uniref:BHLH domain-containing protein n=1 Tax=Heterorhabditis bacteriophora TaxID=37862 RepID=A0A1I7X4W2_HETBA
MHRCANLNKKKRIHAFNLIYVINDHMKKVNGLKQKESTEEQRKLALDKLTQIQERLLHLIPEREKSNSSLDSRTPIIHEPFVSLAIQETPVLVQRASLMYDVVTDEDSDEDAENEKVTEIQEVQEILTVPSTLKPNAPLFEDGNANIPNEMADLPTHVSGEAPISADMNLASITSAIVEGNSFTVLADLQAEEPTDLSIRKGEILTVTQTRFVLYLFFAKSYEILFVFNYTIHNMHTISLVRKRHVRVSCLVRLIRLEGMPKEQSVCGLIRAALYDKSKRTGRQIIKIKTLFKEQIYLIRLFIYLFCYLSSAQNYPTDLPKRKWGKSTEAKPRLFRALGQMPRLLKALKNREKNSPINLHGLEFSKVTVQVHRNLPFARSSAFCFANSRNPHFSLFRTSAGIAHTQ